MYTLFLLKGACAIHCRASEWFRCINFTVGPREAYTSFHRKSKCIQTRTHRYKQTKVQGHIINCTRLVQDWFCRHTHKDYKCCDIALLKLHDWLFRLIASAARIYGEVKFAHVPLSMSVLTNPFPVFTCSNE